MTPSAAGGAPSAPGGKGVVTPILWALRLGLGGLFVYAGIMKLGDPTGFAVEISNYRWLPEWAPWLAMLLPGAEVAAGAVLIVGSRPWARAAALCVIGMLGAFTVAVAQVVMRGINVDCGCFGGSSGPVTWLTVGRDVLLLAAAVAVFAITAPPPPGAPRAR